jgi:hypothetical protein
LPQADEAAPHHPKPRGTAPDPHFSLRIVQSYNNKTGKITHPVAVSQYWHPER